MGLPHKQGVRAFFSFDLAGSTAFKSSAESSFPQGTRRGPTILAPAWLSFFMKFFQDIPERVTAAVEMEFEQADHRIPPFRTEVWRITGDEVLFVTTRLQEEAQLALLARAIYSVLTDIDMELVSEGRSGGSQEFGLKGVLWAAGFPIRNTVFEVHPQSRRVVRRALSSGEPAPPGPSSRAGDPQDSAGYHHREFLGPEIDLGFRLCGHACPRRLLISLDAAELIAGTFAKIPRLLRPRFHHVGWTVLRGLYGGQPYPLIWIDYGAAEKRRSYEAVQSPYADRYFSERAIIKAEEVVQLAEDYLEDTKDTRIKMYIEPSPSPEHALQYEAVERERKS